MKKIFVIFGIIFGLFLSAAIIVPLVVDVDQFRPKIVQAAQERIQGRVELGKLSLSLWGQIRIEVAGLKVIDQNGSEVMSVKDSYFHLPFLPLLSGSPVLTFKMSHPEIHVLKNKAGKINILNLLKPEQKSKEGTSLTQVSPNQTPPDSKTASADALKNLPGIVTRARLGVEFQSAQVSYQDQTTGLISQIKDLNVVLKNMSLEHPTELEVWANFDTKVGKTFLLSGPARLKGQAVPIKKDGAFEKFQLTANLDMDSVEMKSPGLFEKKKGMATRADLAISASPQEMVIEKMSATFFNAVIQAKGTIKQLVSQDGTPSNPAFALQVNSNDVEFKPWVELIPMLKEFDLGGSARLDADIQGTALKPDYKIQLALKHLTAKAPKLKAMPVIEGEVKVIPDQVQKILMTLKAPGNDLQIQGNVVSFSRPKVDLTVSSSGMDLDQLIEFPPPSKGKSEAKGSEKEGTSPGSSATAPSQAKADFDAMVSPIRENPMMAALAAQILINMKSIKAYEVKMTDIGCKMGFKDLAASLSNCGLKVFSGSIQTDAQVALRPRTPTYQFKGKVAGLEIAQAVESQMALFKNTVLGKAFFDISGQGASFNPDPAMANLKANGHFNVQNAVFSTIDIGKAVTEALNKSIDRVASKVPSMKGKQVKSLPSGGSHYEVISSDFKIENKKFISPNFVAKSVPNKGVDVKGTTTVGIQDFSLDSAWEVADTYNLTQAKDLSVEQNGVKVEHILAEGNGPVRFPLHVGCTIKEPCYSYTEVPEFLAKVALNNVTQAVGSRAKQEVQKKAEEVIKNVAPPHVQEELKNKLKGLFGP